MGGLIRYLTRVIPDGLLLSIAHVRFTWFNKCKRFAGLNFKCKLEAELIIKNCQLFLGRGKVITEKFGQGRRVETNYECGFFTNDLPGGPYYQLVYIDFTFIGSDKEEFYLQSVDFDPNGKMKLNYADKVLNGQTTKEDFIKIFGETVKRHFDNPDNKAIVLIANNSDDGARFTFKDGRLVRFEYWTPC
jgi:hypothetical protein